MACKNAVHNLVFVDLAWLVESEASVKFSATMADKSCRVELPDGRVAEAWTWRKCVFMLRDKGEAMTA